MVHSGRLQTQTKLKAGIIQRRVFHHDLSALKIKLPSPLIFEPLCRWMVFSLQDNDRFLASVLIANTDDELSLGDGVKVLRRNGERREDDFRLLVSGELGADTTTVEPRGEDLPSEVR